MKIKRACIWISLRDMHLWHPELPCEKYGCPEAIVPERWRDHVLEAIALEKQGGMSEEPSH